MDTFPKGYVSKKPYGDKSQKMVITSFAELAKQIERQTAKEAYRIDTKLGRARYLVDQKKRLLKKLQDVNAELESMGDERV